MQATAGRKNVRRTDMRIGIAIIALLGLLAAGAIVTVERADAPPGAVAPIPNTLPDAVVNRPLSFEQMRFIEMNTLLPGTKAPIAAIDRQQVIESYRLSGPLPDGSGTVERMRLIEMNMLPGDDAPLVAPFSDRKGERY